MKTRFMSIWDVGPEARPPDGMKRSQRLVWLALEGYPRLAADTLLDVRNRGMVESIVGEAIRQLGKMAQVDPVSRAKCCEALVEVALNLAGMERKRAGFSDQETGAAFKDIVEALRRWEAQELVGVDGAAKQVTQKILSQMNRVLMGQSMVAEMAREIQKGMKDGDLLAGFVLGAREVVQDNVYYEIVDRKMSKVGNDSATGLRWLRHLGAVQVSSNPVIAARAFEETPELWQRFDAVATGHPEWERDPERQADEIALFATVTSLLPNVLDFRPIALLSDFRDGMVSIQLNPLKAGSTEGSVEDARKIYGMLQEILREYDAWLEPDAIFDGRPNVVFKVATTGPSATETTAKLNEMGIGTNNTVTFTASQEVKMAMAAGVGIARALKAGLPVGRVYVTNMEGRLEDHLRETEAARMLAAKAAEDPALGERLAEVAEELGAEEAVRKAGSVAEKAAALCSKKYLKSLTDEWFVAAMGGKTSESLAQMENDIRSAGIIITRRVFQLAFTSGAASKLAAHVQREAGVPLAQARAALGMVDLLPASKRRAEDTLLVLGDSGVANLTNTDFPDQQLKVWMRASEAGFNILRFENSITAPPEASRLKRLLKVEDFRRAYQVAPELAAEMRRVGIEAEAGGLREDEWKSYGPVTKTMREFEGAYTSFRSGLLEHIVAARA